MCKLSQICGVFRCYQQFSDFFLCVIESVEWLIYRAWKQGENKIKLVWEFVIFLPRYFLHSYEYMRDGEVESVIGNQSVRWFFSTPEIMGFGGGGENAFIFFVEIPFVHLFDFFILWCMCRRLWDPFCWNFDEFVFAEFFLPCPCMHHFDVHSSCKLWSWGDGTHNEDDDGYVHEGKDNNAKKNLIFVTLSFIYLWNKV